MDLNYLSDYGTGSSSNSSPSTSWPSSGASSLLQLRSGEGDARGHRAASFQNLVTGRCTLDDIMREFRMNGSDTPLDTFDDNIWSNQAAEQLAGMGPASAYVRQKSWPAPDSSPAPRLPRAPAAPAAPAASWPAAAAAHDFLAPAHEFATSTPINDVPASHSPELSSPLPTAEQWRVLSSLPNAVLFPLLQRLEQSRGEAERRPRRYNECRFCKNNGERESYYRSHTLKDTGGRVTCPVLRAFVCKRCGASGDAAHTSKYCPLSTADERMKSAAMMRSVRMASGRRRYSLPGGAGAADDHYVVFGETTTSAILDNNIYNSYLVTPPLDPSWAALEQKLLL